MIFWPFPFAVWVMLAVAVFICLRDFLHWRIPIWWVTLAGALLVIVTGVITPYQSVLACDPDVLLYLLGTFILAAGLEITQAFDLLILKIGLKDKNISAYVLLAIVVFVVGLLAAILMNDTMAIAVTPFILLITEKQKSLRLPLLLALAYSITIGSVLTPLGNPQNLLIMQISDMAHPFLTFFKYFFVPTLVNLALLYVILAIIFRKTLTQSISAQKRVNKGFDEKQAHIALQAVYIFVALIMIGLLLSIFQVVQHLQIVWFVLLPAIYLLIRSKARIAILSTLDWGTLIFFISLFILVRAVWLTGYLQTILLHQQKVLVNPFSISSCSITLSQVVSNVPLVMLFSNILHHVHAPLSLWFMLAASSTFAGSVTILGAASNVIIIQMCEKRDVHAFHSIRFMLYGLPLCLINISLCWLYWQWI